MIDFQGSNLLIFTHTHAVNKSASIHQGREFKTAAPKEGKLENPFRVLILDDG